VQLVLDAMPRTDQVRPAVVEALPGHTTVLVNHSLDGAYDHPLADRPALV
jgi:hypothetical protein